MWERDRTVCWTTQHRNSKNLANSERWRIFPCRLPACGENGVRRQKGSLRRDANQGLRYASCAIACSMKETFKPRLILFSHLASRGNLDRKEMDDVTAGKISNKGCILLRFVRMTASYVWVPWASELKNKNFLRSLAKNENVGLLGGCQNMGGLENQARQQTASKEAVSP